MDKKTYYVAVDKNRTWRSIKSGTKNIAQTYICIHDYKNGQENVLCGCR